MNPSINKVFKTREVETVTYSKPYHVECEFCNNICLKETSQGHNIYYCCNRHGDVKVKYLIADHPEIWYTLVFAVETKKRYFHVSFFFDNKYMNEMFRIDEVFNVGKMGSYATTVFSLEFQPNGITPENVADKMSLWIP